MRRLQETGEDCSAGRMRPDSAACAPLHLSLRFGNLVLQQKFFAHRTVPPLQGHPTLTIMFYAVLGLLVYTALRTPTIK